MLVAALFFSACLVTSWHVVKTNDGPLTILGMPLSVAGARLLFEGVGVASAIFVAVGIPAFLVGLFSSHYLTLTPTEISAPKYGFSRRVTIVPLTDIQSIDLQIVRRHRFLNIRHTHGKLTITESFLPNAAAFEQVRSALAARLRAK
jgi:hypothetical protein